MGGVALPKAWRADWVSFGNRDSVSLILFIVLWKLVLEALHLKNSSNPWMNSMEPTGSETWRLGFESPYLGSCWLCMFPAQTLFCGGWWEWEAGRGWDTGYWWGELRDTFIQVTGWQWPLDWQPGRSRNGHIQLCSNHRESTLKHRHSFILPKTKQDPVPHRSARYQLSFCDYSSQSPDIFLFCPLFHFSKLPLGCQPLRFACWEPGSWDF